MVAQHQMLHEQPLCSRKVRNCRQLFLDHPDPDCDVPEQLAFHRVIEACPPLQLTQLPDIVQHHAGQKQIAIDIRVMPGGHFAQPHQ